MEVILKLKSVKIDYFIININKWNKINLELIQKKFKQFNVEFHFIENAILIFKSDFEISEIKNFLCELINLKLYNFNAYLIYFNEYSNILKTKITEIYFENKLNIKKYYYDYFKDFLKSKNLINQVIMNKNKRSMINSDKIEGNNNNRLIICINNFNEINKEFIILLNLFCIFGNIKTIFYNFENIKVYILYDKKKSLNRLIENKQILKYNNIKIDIEVLFLGNIIDNLFIKPVYLKKKKLNIFLNINIKMKYNHPNNKVMIYNVNSNFRTFEFYNLVNTISKPLLIKFKNKKLKNTKICIIMFKTIQESVELIAHLSNKRINNFKIKCIFSHYIFDI